jgi:hypothetical protein
MAAAPMTVPGWPPLNCGSSTVHHGSYEGGPDLLAKICSETSDRIQDEHLLAGL